MPAGGNQNYFNAMKKFSGFRFCPRCSSEKIRGHVKNAIKCTSCGYVYFHNTAATVVGIIEVKDRVLLIKRAHEPQIGYFDLPGGFVDYKESFEDALHREIKEECNLDIIDMRYFGSFPNTYQYCKVKYFTADAFFVCRPAGLKKMKLSDEASEYILAEISTFDMDALAFDSIRAALKEYKNV
jgi:NAD+ diphosphatase